MRSFKDFYILLDEMIEKALAEKNYVSVIALKIDNPNSPDTDTLLFSLLTRLDHVMVGESNKADELLFALMHENPEQSKLISMKIHQFLSQQKMITFQLGYACSPRDLPTFPDQLIANARNSIPISDFDNRPVNDS